MWLQSNFDIMQPAHVIISHICIGWAKNKYQLRTSTDINDMQQLNNGYILSNKCWSVLQPHGQTERCLVNGRYMSTITDIWSGQNHKWPSICSQTVEQWLLMVRQIKSWKSDSVMSTLLNDDTSKWTCCSDWASTTEPWDKWLLISVSVGWFGRVKIMFSM